MAETLNLPAYDVRLSDEGGRRRIFDVLRRRFVAVTPEEWVRQHFIHYLIDHKGYPQALLANEISLTLNGMWRRCDSVLYTADMQPRMIMEYKAPTVAITQEVFNQICAYNAVLRVPYLTVSNGLTHYCCHIDYDTNTTTFLPDIPEYSQL